jgi:hypothetical protein
MLLLSPIFEKLDYECHVSVLSTLVLQWSGFGFEYLPGNYVW